MDFGKLDLRETAEKQFWIHLRIDDAILFADEEQKRPCRVKVASITEPGIEAALKAVERAGRSSAAFENQLTTANRQQRAEITKRADEAERQAEKCITRFLIAVVKGWENIERDGAELEYSSEALEDMSQPKAPLFRLASTISKDMARIYDPFSQAESV